MRFNRTCRWPGLGLLLLLSIQCGGPEGPRQSIPLAPLVSSSEVHSEWRRPEWKKMGSLGLYGLAGDWLWREGSKAEAGGWIEVFSPRLEFPFSVVSKVDREVSFFVRAEKPRTLRILLNGQEAGQVEPLPRAWNFRIALPADRLNIGLNRLEFEGVEGAFFNRIEIRAAGTQPNPKIPTTPVVAGPDIAQPAGTAIRFDLRLPAHATFHFKPDASRQAAARASVQLQRGTAEVQTLWTSDQSTDEGCCALELETDPNEVAQIRLVVEGPPGAGNFRWQYPEVRGLADPPPTPLPQADVPKSPAVVVIILDAGAAGRFSLYGSPANTTPHIDRLSREALSVARAYTPSSWTLPFVASLFTGFYPATHGVSHFNYQLGETVDTLAERAKTQGYRTILLSQHPGLLTRTTLAQGFDLVQAMPRDAVEFRQKLESSLPEKDPFFLYLHLIVPHLPYTPPAPYPSLYNDPQYQPGFDGTQPTLSPFINRLSAVTTGDLQQIRALYDANLRYADTLTGETLDLLRQRKLYDQAVIAVLADHGEALWEHGHWMHGPILNEEVTRVPFVLRLPASSSRLLPGPIETIRLNATLASGLGLPVSQGSGSVLPITAKFNQPDDACLTIYHYRNALGSMYSWRRDRWSYIFSAIEPERRLYDLLADPAETRNLAPENPALVTQLHAEMNQALSRQAALSHVVGGGDTFELDQETQDELKRLGYVD